MTSPLLARRSFLGGLIAAPAVLRLGLWMPVKKIVAAPVPSVIINIGGMFVTPIDRGIKIGDVFVDNGVFGKFVVVASTGSGFGTVVRVA